MSTPELSASLRADFVRLLEQQFGLRLAPREARQIDQVVFHLLASRAYPDPAALYAAFAAGSDRQALEVLATSLTVGETHFFRVTPQIEALRRVVIPDLIARHATDRRLRLWSAGCSTGEEAYTLAMLLCEQLPTRQAWDIQLMATDLNRAALEVARLALYGEWSFRDSPLDVRSRYFTPVGSRWQLAPQVREMVRFDHLNLAVDRSPFALTGDRIDLILCRNVTIYFGDDTTQRLYARFADALDPAGWLVLGPSDPVPVSGSAFEVFAVDGALLWRHRQKVAAVALTRQDRRGVLPRAVATTRPVGARRAAGSTRPDPTRVQNASMDPLIHLHLGMVQLGEGAPAAAIESLRRAAFLDETSPLIQFSLGKAYQQIGSPTRSRSAFSLARRLLAGLADDQLVAGGELVTGELRNAVEVQLADLDNTRP